MKKKKERAKTQLNNKKSNYKILKYGQKFELMFHQ